ncbi:protachykinin-1 isoform X1 [Pelobates cultripes]|uniref:Protachykinin-1 isoform X1 n=1 Tax=Pelobates cultripes TaxID=61616 RepID=A0AAD1RW79_PELCU|nr:protachykinin-1 isoform X1 [Pelobates cultripes]
MNLAVVCVVFFLAVTQTLSEEMEYNEDRYWPESNLHQADLQTDIEDPALERFLLRIARKARPGQILELIAKRSKEFKRNSPKRQNSNSFVGLMGKRSLSSESEESAMDLDFNRRR